MRHILDIRMYISVLLLQIEKHIQYEQHHILLIDWENQQQRKLIGW